MKPLRFCFLTTFYPPYNFGGDGIGIQRFARGLVARGHEVTVVHDVDAHATLSSLSRLAPSRGGRGRHHSASERRRPTLVPAHPAARAPGAQRARIRRILDDGDSTS